MSTATLSDGVPASRFAGTLFDLLDRVEYRRVNPDAHFDPVYHLRYEAYRRESFIPASAEQIVRDEFDDLPNAHCFGVYIDGELVSSVRFHHLTSSCRMSPSYSVFGDVLDPLLDRGKVIVDPGRFTADHEATLAYPALPFLTLRIPTMTVPYFNVDYVLQTVRREHMAFYRRVYRAELLAEERHYHGLTFPMVLLATDAPVVYPGLLERFPFFRSTQEEREALFGPPGRTGLDKVRPSARIAQRIAELDAELV